MSFRSVTALLFALLAVALAGRARAQNVLISEFMASNSSALADDDGDFSDWVELYNPGAADVNLDGWYLTDNASKLTKWRFPAVTLPAKGFLIVFASDKDRTDPTKPLHANLKLSAGGEYLGLIKPDGVTVSSEYAPTFPPQQTDVSYGMVFDGFSGTLVAAGTPARAFVPTDGSLGTSWTVPAFNPSGWLSGTTGVGFERGTGFESLIGLDVGAQMFGKQNGAYIRIPFSYSGDGNLDALTLRMKYDDGFVAYLNGTPVASANVPVPTLWNSPAPVFHDDSVAVQFQDFDITAFKSALVTGDNVLAIHGLNNGVSSSDFLMIPELTASSSGAVQPDKLRYFPQPTPGAPNGSGIAQGPAILTASHTPNVPTDAEDLLVTARIAPTNSLVQGATLTYRVDFGAEASVPMLGDGDGHYTATIPASASNPGQMVRYFVAATDVDNNPSRYPAFSSPTKSPQYLGTMVADPNVNTVLPVLYWWVENPTAAETRDGAQSTIFYNGRLYDNVFTRLRGNTSADWPKKNIKFDMNSGAYFDYDPNVEPVEEFNLQSTFSDKTYMRQVLAWETYAKAGVPGSLAFPLRVQRNGSFFSVAEWVEQPDELMLARNGLDPDGALYKMYNEVTDAAVREDWVEKKTRESEDSSDLQALVTGVTYTGSALTNYLFDNVDVPETINYLAATSIMHDNDAVAKNFYLYRDSDGNGEWKFIPWDKDLTFGRNFTTGGGVLNDTIWAAVDPYSHPFFGDSAHPKVDGPWNRLIDALYREPTIRQMYLRRLRTVMENVLQAPGTPPTELQIEKRIDQLVARIGADVALDRAKWGAPYGQDQSLSSAVSIMKNSYLAVRRRHLFNTHSTPGDKLIPGSQPSVPALAFGVIERSPVSGNANEQFIQVVNPTDGAVDISGWTIGGGVAYTFRPGVVVPAHGSVYVSPDVNAFRARPAAPKGGMGLLVQGDYNGTLPPTGGALILKTAAGVQVAPVPLTMADAGQALSIAAGFAIASTGDIARLNVATNDASATVVDISDALAIARGAAAP
jgi:hypothetical protein